MTQEDKDLLLKDLCARLPYGVKVDIPNLFVSTKTDVEVLNEIFCGDDGEFRCNASGMLIRYVKPYLYPLSSMTDEQKEEFNTKSLELQLKVIDDEIMYEKATEFEVDFYNKHHLDWRQLIPKDLALDATGKNIY